MSPGKSLENHDGKLTAQSQHLAIWQPPSFTSWGPTKTLSLREKTVGLSFLLPAQNPAHVVTFHPRSYCDPDSLSKGWG